jgi:ubiquinone/menaquinone biosynthesis C-methylase UbiE
MRLQPSPGPKKDPTSFPAGESSSNGPQERQGVASILRQSSGPGNGEGNWQTRQTEMEDWYRQFASRDNVAKALDSDYQPYAKTLATLRGSVIDIGGGAGVTAGYLNPKTEYVVLDPSSMWLCDEWTAISERISTSGPKPRRVAGVGEKLPFSANRFDAALAFWSLNHGSDPEQCVREMHRVLKPHGLALIVLEDMEPSWADTAHRAVQSIIARFSERPPRLNWHQPDISTTLATIRNKLSGQAWPLQSDHLRIRERDLRRWFKGRFKMTHRTWDGGYMSYQLRRADQ